MSVARVTELSAISEQGFEDAIEQAIARATKTLRGVGGYWVKDMNVIIEDGKITGYKVNVEVTFLLENGHEVGSAQETGAEETSGFERRSSDYVGGSVDAADESFREEYR
jgi:flavin-binding protein dodecin